MFFKSVILVTLLLSNILFAQTLSIESEKFIFDKFELFKFVDASNSVTIQTLQKDSFTQTVPNTYSNGFVPHQSIWHSFAITNNLSHSVEFIFNDALYYLPAQLDLYILNSKGQVIHSYFGGFNRDDTKFTDVGHLSSFFRIAIASHETYTFYIKTYFEKGNSSIYDYKIYDIDSHINTMIYENVLVAFLLGGMLILLLYNLLIYLFTRDKIYLYYLGSLFFSFVIGFVFVSGFVYKFFAITNNAWIHNATYATPLTMIFVMLFTATIFEMQKFYPRLYKFFQLSIYFVSGYVVLSILFDLLEYLPIIMGFALLLAFGIVFLGIYMTYKKNKFGLIYLTSTASYALFAIITIAYYLGFLPMNIFTSNTLMIGSLAEGLGFSFLLAYRITLLKEQNNSLSLLSTTDGLTGLYNRRHFNDVAPTAINSAKRDNKIFAFAMLDIDNFKLYNDTYGHQAGDNVLMQVANSLQHSFQRSHDLLFRLGGEEFGIIFSAKSVEEIETLAQKAKANIEALAIEHIHNPPSNVVTASFGLGIYSINDFGQNLAIEKIYKDVDALLYEAKALGKNRVAQALFEEK